MRDNFDIAIVGAGAAGLAATARLRQTPLEVVLLEARARVGGRAWTIHSQPGLALDAGCEWLHSATHNLLAPLIEARGFTIDRSPPHWGRQSGAQGFAIAEQRAFGHARAAFAARLAAAAHTGLDAPAAAFLEPGGRWNPLIDAVSSWYNGAEYDQVSVLDYAAYDDGGVNWRVREGYGQAIAAVAGPLEPVLDCPVQAVEHGQTPVRLVTGKGALTARAVIVTVSTPILAQGRIRFDPDLPGKRDAAAGLPLGVADKAFLAVGRPEDLPVEGHLFGRTDRTETASYHLRPYGLAAIEAYFGGRLAHQLEGEGEGAFAAFAMEELAALLGADFRRSLTPMAETAWAADRWALGSYSHALPGRAGDRARLAAPVDGRLFFAGEATHPSAFSTAHGAWESGLRAAAEAMAALGV